MAKDRIILHSDANSFFASVEETLDPSLKNVPMAVCGDPKSRHGIILAKNQLAKKYKIQTAETIWQAKQKCPELVLVAPHYEEYVKLSGALNQIYLSKTDLVEPFGIDESWLDVTNSAHLFGTGVEIANSLRKEVKESLGLTISVGVSYNKAFAKLGSDYKKPDATTEITRENLRQFVWGLPVESLIFVGDKAQKSLEKINISTIGDLACASLDNLVRIMGKQGEMLWTYANGRDNSPVRSYFEKVLPKSVGNGMTFKRNLLGEEDLKVAIFILCSEVSERLKDVKLYANGLSVSLKDPDFKVKNRQCILPSSTQSEGMLRKYALDLALKNTDLKKPLRAVTITAINLTPDSIKQISLFGDDSDREKQERLENAVACLKKKMGNGVLESASVLASDLKESQTLKSNNSNGE